LRAYYATDIHGSTLCFKKFLNAGKFYKANVVILGGDITGKLIVPIVEHPDERYTCKYAGTTYDLKRKEDMDQLRERIENQGNYPYVTNREEMEEFGRDKSKVDELFTKLMRGRVEAWVSLADERLRNQSHGCYIQPGNDDRYEIDAILAKSERIINPEGRVLQVDRDHEMISTGHANITPWKCPRDEPEDRLDEIVNEMASRVKNMENCIFNFHCPPYDTSLDKGPKLDENMKPVPDVSGGIQMVPVGSTAIRNAIEKYQPLLGLHGHIHESKASQNLGRTLLLNPGSEYGEGILRGAIVELNEKGIRNHIFVQG
jgi:Icc-related predicted phosphoesterase